MFTSTSPRRKALLEQMGWRIEKDFRMVQAAVTLEPDQFQKRGMSLEEAKEAAERTARKKIQHAVYNNRELVQHALNPQDTIVVGADTVVFCEDMVLDRPLLKALEHAGPDDIEAARARAKEMLGAQKGKTIHVITGLAAAIGDDYRNPECVTVVTSAKMKDYSDFDIENYIRASEPFDMAGSFGIQGKGISLFKEIHGSYYNVVGLPLRELISLLRRPKFSEKFAIPTFRSFIEENKGTINFSPRLSSLCVGDINYDFVYDELPEGFFDDLVASGKKIKIKEKIYRGAGGTAVQFAKGAKNAGFKTCMVVGVVGGDALGQEIEEELYNDDITPLLPKDHSQKTSVVIILRDSARKDTSITLIDSYQSLPRAVVSRVTRDIENSDVFYCSGYCLIDGNRKANAEEMMRIAKRAKRLVVFDVVVGMQEYFSYENLRSSLRSENVSLSCVDIFVSELPEIFAWFGKRYDEKNILECWEESKSDIAEKLRRDFPIAILRTPTYSHEIIISPDNISDPVKLDYPLRSSRERIGYRDRRTAQLVYEYLSPRIVLASKSPQRLNLLQQIVALEKVEVHSSTYHEEYDPYEKPFDRVKRLASEKAKAVFNDGNFSDTIEFIIGADTEIIYEKNKDEWELIGHPETSEQATTDLQKLSGKCHYAITGIAIIGLDPIKERLMIISDCVRTKVEFVKLNRDEISSYAASKEPIGRAGAYAIQGLGALFIESIEGSYSNVVGLPLERLSDMLAENFKRPIWSFDKVSSWNFPKPIKGLKLEESVGKETNYLSTTTEKVLLNEKEI